MKTIKHTLGGMLAIALLVMGVVASPVGATPSYAASTRAICYTAQSYQQGTQDWAGKNPKSCPGSYQLYDMSGPRPALIMQIRNTKAVSFQQLIAKEYADAQRWCSNNSLTCTIITGVAFALVGRYFK